MIFVLPENSRPLTANDDHRCHGSGCQRWWSNAQGHYCCRDRPRRCPTTGPGRDEQGRGRSAHGAGRASAGDRIGSRWSGPRRSASAAVRLRLRGLLVRRGVRAGARRVRAGRPRRRPCVVLDEDREPASVRLHYATEPSAPHGGPPRWARLPRSPVRTSSRGVHARRALTRPRPTAGNRHDRRPRRQARTHSGGHLRGLPGPRRPGRPADHADQPRRRRPPPAGALRPPRTRVGHLRHGVARGPHDRRLRQTLGEPTRRRQAVHQPSRSRPRREARSPTRAPRAPQTSRRFRTSSHRSSGPGQIPALRRLTSRSWPCPPWHGSSRCPSGRSSVTSRTPTGYSLGCSSNCRPLTRCVGQGRVPRTRQVRGPIGSIRSSRTSSRPGPGRAA